MRYTHVWRNGRWVRVRQPRGVAAATAVHGALFPVKALASAAAGTDGFASIMAAALNLADWLCVGVIMYAGAMWMFDDRTKALERLLGGGIGYAIIRNAPRIRDFIKAVVG